VPNQPSPAPSLPRPGPHPSLPRSRGREGKGAVIIAGGGPVGLIVALMLGRAGIAVTLFDQGDIVHSQPRAATVHPATLDILDDLGAYALLEPQGIVCPIVNYYDGRLKLASFDHAVLKDETRHPWVLQCEQDKLSRTLFAMGKANSNIAFRTATKVVGCSQRDDAVEVVVEAADGQRERHRALYLVGADGARSTIREAIGVAFAGFTYPERCLIIGTPYDFAADGYAYRNYIADPEEWYNLFKISWQGPPGVYRLVVPLRPDEPLDGDRALATAQRKLQRFNPRPRSYDIAFYDSYTVAQRVAATFRKGRVLLAGDSAHLNSPIGAMGMNSGIHDAVNLAGNLIRVLSGEESDAALDRYVRQRRHVATAHVQTATIANKQNMEQRDPVKRQRYRDDMRRRAEDPALAKAFLMRTALIDSLQDAAKIP
jgi:2-polyprenyl-6-methoxyphenol hydroxylase-like FAD-dependent oxidoreductase